MALRGGSLRVTIGGFLSVTTDITLPCAFPDSNKACESATAPHPGIRI